MGSYETLIMEMLEGGTPKQKYEYLKKLEYENRDYIIRLNITRTLLQGLADSSDDCSLGNLRPFIEATYKQIL